MTIDISEDAKIGIAISTAHTDAPLLLVRQRVKPTQRIGRRQTGRVGPWSEGLEARRLMSVTAPADPNDQIAEAFNLGVISTTPAVIPNGYMVSPNTDVDISKFTVAAGQDVGFDVDRVSGSSLDSYLRLFNSSGVELANNDNAAAPVESLGLDSYLEYTFTTAGTYYVGVGSKGNQVYNATTGAGDTAGTTTGGYKFSAVLISTAVTTPPTPNSPADTDDQIAEAHNFGALRITPTVITGNVVTPNTDVDMFKFTASAGQSADFNIDFAPGSSLDSYLRLINSSGVELANNDNGIAPGETLGLDSYLAYTFNAAGTYYVGVSSKGNQAYNATTGAGDTAGTTTGGYKLTAALISSVVDTSLQTTSTNVLSGDAGNNQLLYFTSSSLTADDKHLIFISDRTSNNPNVFVRDLTTGVETQLSHHTQGYLKSYVYYAGNPYQGFGKASVCVDAVKGLVYYIEGVEIHVVDLTGHDRVLATLPNNQMTAYTAVSADGKYLCIPTTDDAVLQGSTRLTGLPSYDIDALVQSMDLSSYLHVYDTTTGQEVQTVRVEKAWVTHVQFSPVNSSLILYNHESTNTGGGTDRIWLWNGQKNIQLRTPGNGRYANDWVDHEMWERDGSGIIYHGHYQDGIPFIGRVNADGTGTVEIPLPKAWNRYGHFTVGASGELVTDGYYVQPGDPPGAAAWVSLLRVDWTHRTIRWYPLIRDGSKWASQDDHPHPVFNHDCTAIYYTSDVTGKRSVYRVSVPK